MYSLWGSMATAGPRGGVWWKLTGEVWNRMKMKRRKAGKVAGEPAALGEALFPSGTFLVVATVSHEVLRYLPGETSRPPP